MLLGMLSFWSFVAGFLTRWVFIVLSLILIVAMGYIDEWPLEFAFTVGMFVARKLLLVFYRRVRLHASRITDENSTHITPSTSQQLTEEVTVPDSQSQRNDFMPGSAMVRSIGDIDTGQTILSTQADATNDIPLTDSLCDVGLTRVVHSQEIPACSEYNTPAWNGRTRTRKKLATARPYCTNLHGCPPDKVRRRVLNVLDIKSRICRDRAQINFVTGKAPVCKPGIQELVLELCKQRGFHAFIGDNEGVIICELSQATRDMNTSHGIDDKSNANHSLLSSPEVEVNEESCGDDLVSVLSTQDNVYQEMPPAVPILDPDADQPVSVDIRRLSHDDTRRRVIEALHGTSGGANPTQIIFITGKRRESKCRTRKIVREVCKEMGFLCEFQTRQRDILCELTREVSEEGADTGWKESTTTTPELGDHSSFSTDEAESLVNTESDEDELTNVVPQQKILRNSQNDIDHMSESVMETQMMDVDLPGRLSSDEVRSRVTEVLHSFFTQAGNSAQITFQTGKNTRRKHEVQDLVRRSCATMGIFPEIRTTRVAVICDLSKDRPWRYPDAIPVDSDLWKKLPAEPQQEMRQKIVPMRTKLPRRKRRRRETPLVDLHGLTKYEATAMVESVLADPPKVRVVPFITGRGIHSPGRVPVLRPHVLKLCQDRGFAACIDRANEGIVRCYLP